MNRWTLRLAVGAACAAPLMFFSVVAATAQPSDSPPPSGELTCRACHGDTHASWMEGSHGQASASESYLADWEARGKPRECLACHTTGYDAVSDTYQAEGVTCEACHSPAPANHPTDPMPSDRSGKLCGTCHTETMFEWQVSKHREVNLACVACHDPHATSLKATVENGGDSTMCASCHRERASNYAHSAHSQVGLGCADCHLGPTDSEAGEGHATRDHSFNVRLTTCNACHAYQMHDPSQVHPDQATPTPAVPAVLSPSTPEGMMISASPSPVSPIGFAALSGLVGMATGMILAPWLERFYNKIRRDDQREE